MVRVARLLRFIIFSKRVIDKDYGYRECGHA